MNENKKIKDLRAHINSIDDELLKLLLHRFDLVKKIGAIKRELEIKIADSSREEEIINRLSLRSTGKIKRDDIASIFRPIYEVSKKLQSKEK
tara:strand:+ start:75643 stop:75918 length:276 start_codon:yes stop_codon:yes gene_type:complete